VCKASRDHRPLPGVITARNVDPGDLISADNSATKEMFHLMRRTPCGFRHVRRCSPPVSRWARWSGICADDPLSSSRAGDAYADALDPNTPHAADGKSTCPTRTTVLRPGMSCRSSSALTENAMPVRISAAPCNAHRRAAGRSPGRENRVQLPDGAVGRDSARRSGDRGLNVGETIVVHPGDDLPADRSSSRPLPKYGVFVLG